MDPNDKNYATAVTAAYTQMVQSLKPAVLAEVDSNAVVIRNYLTKRGLDFTDVRNLLDAVEQLDQKELILWSTPPRVVTAPKLSLAEHQAIFENKERERLKREAEENAKPFDIAVRAQQAKEQKEHEKRQLDAKSALYNLLAKIEHYAPEVSALLSTVKIHRGKFVDHELTLKAVQKLYPHPDTTVSDINRNRATVVPQVINEANGVIDEKAIKAERQRTRENERRSFVGSAAHLRRN